MIVSLYNVFKHGTEPAALYELIELKHGEYMKKIKSILTLAASLALSIISVFFITSCQKSSSDNSNNNLNGNCMQNQAGCQSGIYQQGYGFYPYNNGNGYGGYNGSNYQGGYQTSNSAYLCNCPGGTIPTYNNYGGLGCVNNTYVSGNGGHAYFHFNIGGSTNNQWTNIPQISNYTGYTNQSSCYNGVVQSCLVDQAATCSAGYTCRATSAQSRLGLCVSAAGANGSGGVYNPTR